LTVTFFAHESATGPDIVRLVPPAIAVREGSSASLTLKLSAAPGTDTEVMLTSSDADVARVSGAAMVPAGHSEASVPIDGIAPGVARVTASLHESSASSHITVTSAPPALVSLVPVLSTVTLGASTALQLTISAAQADDTVVPLASTPPGILSLPDVVTVPANQLTAEVPIDTVGLGQAHVTAVLNGSVASAVMNVAVPPLEVVVLEPESLRMTLGAASGFTVGINVAQASSLEIALASSDPAVLEVPASITVPAGQTSASFVATARAVGDAVVTASANATSRQSSVHVFPHLAVVTALVPNPLPLQEGATGLLTVTIDPAQEEHTAIALANASPAVTQVPPSVTVPAGALTAEVPVTALSAGKGTITASLNGTSVSAVVKVAPPPPIVTIMTPAVLVLPKGTPGSLRLGISRGPAVPTAVALHSSDETVLSVPTAVTVAAGALFADFAVASMEVGETTVVASLNGRSASAQVTVSAPEPLILALLPEGPTALVGESLSFSAIATMTDGSTEDLTSRAEWSSSAPSVASVDSVGVASALVAGETTVSARFTFTQAATGQVTTVTASTLLTVVRPELHIDAIDPTSGPVGSSVELRGAGFDTSPAANVVVFLAAQGGTVAAPVLAASPTRLSVRVPPAAESGPIRLTNARGSVLSPPFTVLRERDFQLVVSPAAVTVYAGARGSAQVQLASIGTQPFTGLVALATEGLPAGTTARFVHAPVLSASQTVVLELTAAGDAIPGTYAVTVRGEFVEAGQPLARTARFDLTIRSAAGVTGVKGRFVRPDGVGIAGVIARVDLGSGAIQTATDAAGNFQLVGFPGGQVTLRFDATPANPLYPIWPYTTALPANQVTVLPDWTISPPPLATSFTPIANAAQEQVITDPRFPGLEIRLPAGASIMGWDGVPKNRIAVERVEIAKLPVPAPPTPTGAAYQLYFGTPMGGIPSVPIPMTLPNDVAAEPGESVDVWFFDGSPMAASGEWRIAGPAIITPDGKSARMPPGTGVPRFCGVCGLMCLGKQPPAPNPPPGPCGAGNPIELSTGQEMPDTGRLSCRGLTPIETGMSYNPVDAFDNIGGTVGSMGFGWVLDYDIAFLPFVGPQKRLVLPGNKRINFVDDGAGNYKPFDDPRFDGAVFRATGSGANEWELTLRDRSKWRFKPFSTIFVRGGPPTFLTEIVDPQGNVLQVNRQTNGRITSIGTGERGVSMTYGPNGFVSEIRDSADRTTQYTYTADDRIEAVTDPDGRVTRYTYVGDEEFAVPPVCAAQPSFGKRIKMILYPGRPNPTENSYGPGRRVLRQVGYDGREYRFAYRVTGACVTHLSSPNAVCQGAQCPNVDSWDNFQAGWRIFGGTVIATTVTKPGGQTYTNEFNARGITTAHTDAQGQRTSVNLDAANRITERTDALGRTWKYRYDANGSVVEFTDPLGRVIQYTYDPKWNQVANITRFDEVHQPQTWQFTYDPDQGTLLTAKDPLDATTSFTYTPRGELETVRSPLDQVTRFEYGQSGDLFRIIDPLGNTSRFGYDRAGRLVAATDPSSFQTSYRYNGIDLLTEVTDALAQVTGLDYDPAGRPAGVTNASGKLIESYAYDDFDRLSRRTDSAGLSTLYEYDAAGRLEKVTDGRGLETEYAYDDQDRIVSITRPEGVTGIRYDAGGRLSEISEPSGTLTYTYDSVDRLMREVQSTGGMRAEITYQYDALDRRVSRTASGVAGETTTYGYDSANRLRSIANRGDTTTFDYDPAGRLRGKTLPNGIRQEITYDDANRLLAIVYKNPDETIIDAIAYRYDANGRRIAQVSDRSPLPDTVFTAVYDDADRMTSITFTATGETFDLGYDENGNLATRVERGVPGNVTLYGWDSRNRLTSIRGQGVEATFDYDARDRRIARTVNGQRADYIYDGAQAIGELTNGRSIGLLTALGIDEVIARYSQPGGRYYLTDALNTVIAQTQADRSIQNSYLYSPWGETSSIGPDESNPIQYTARENDGTGLYYYRARYYDPRIKRFLSEDPIGFEGGFNLYTYAGNDPVSLNDPHGLEPPDTPKKPINLFPPDLPLPPQQPPWLCPAPGPPPPRKCEVAGIEFTCLAPFPDFLKGDKPEGSPLPPAHPNPPPELPPTPSWPKFWKTPNIPF
jgi:RHS repeat-associated protein